MFGCSPWQRQAKFDNDIIILSKHTLASIFARMSSCNRATSNINTVWVAMSMALMRKDT